MGLGLCLFLCALCEILFLQGPALAAGSVELYLIPHTHADVGWLQTLDSLSRVNAYSCGNSEESKLTQRLQHLRVLVDDPLKPPIRRNGGQHALLQKAPLVHT